MTAFRLRVMEMLIESPGPTESCATVDWQVWCSARAKVRSSGRGRSRVRVARLRLVRSDEWQETVGQVVFLAALASVTCLFRANVREIISAPGGREAMERALAANAEIAAREGHPPSAFGLDFARTRLTDPAGPWSASMLRDLESGGRVEVDHIVGWMLDRARRHGVDDTLLSVAFTHLKAFEARREADRLPGR